MVYTLPILGKLLQSLSRNPWWPEVRSGGGGDGKRYQIGLGIGGGLRTEYKRIEDISTRLGPYTGEGLLGRFLHLRLKLGDKRRLLKSGLQ